MKNITRVADNTAGIFPKFYFTLAANLPDSFPLDGASIVGDLALAEGTAFNYFEATAFTPDFDQSDEDDTHGDYYSHNFKGFCAGDTPELATAMMSMKGKRFVLLYQDHNGHLKLIGDKEYYLVFDYKLTPGTTPGERKGYRFTFKGKSRNPAYFYSGKFTVAEEGVVEQPVVEGGAPVRLEDTNGNLITLIPAGKTLVIRSGFKLTYTII